jgi:hypothetical protein
MNDDTIHIQFDERGYLLPSKVIVINYPPKSMEMRVYKPYPPKPHISLRDPSNIYYGHTCDGSSAITDAVTAVEVRIQLHTKEAMWDPFSEEKVLIPFLDSDGNLHPTTKAKFMALPYEDRLGVASSSHLVEALNDADASDLLDPPGRGPLYIYLVRRTDSCNYEDVMAYIVTAYTEVQAIWISKHIGNIWGDDEDLEVTKVGYTDTLPPRKLILDKHM